MVAPDIRIAFFDIDGTLHHGETIWESLHKKNNTWDSLGRGYLDQFLAGDIDFETFARLDVAAWEGLAESTLQEAINEVMIFDEAVTVIDLLRSRGCHIYLISNGIAQFAEVLVRRHGLTGYRANPLSLINGRLSGHIDIRVPYKSKGNEVLQLLTQSNLTGEHAMAVGDGPGDVEMLNLVRHPFFLSPDGQRSDAYTGPYIQHWNDIIAYLE